MGSQVTLKNKVLLMDTLMHQPIHWSQGVTVQVVCLEISCCFCWSTNIRGVLWSSYEDWMLNRFINRIEPFRGSSSFISPKAFLSEAETTPGGKGRAAETCFPGARRKLFGVEQRSMHRFLNSDLGCSPTETFKLPATRFQSPFQVKQH